MAWDEAKYTIDQVLNGIEDTSLTGIPPADSEMMVI